MRNLHLYYGDIIWNFIVLNFLTNMFLFSESSKQKNQKNEIIGRLHLCLDFQFNYRLKFCEK
jgi:hypothetical protein